nr:MAG TPA: hypothetical protein [Caudoviricetes sp.]
MFFNIFSLNNGTFSANFSAFSIFSFNSFNSFSYIFIIFISPLLIVLLNLTFFYYLKLLAYNLIIQVLILGFL